MTIPKTIIALKWMAHELHHGKQMTMDGCLDAMQLFVIKGWKSEDQGAVCLGLQAVMGACEEI